MLGLTTNHVKGSASRDSSVLPLDILDAFAWQADRNHGPEPKDLFNESGDVRDFLLDEAFFPCVAVGINGHDLVIGAILNVLTMGRREVGDAHDEVTRDGVEAGRYHCQTD